MNETKEFFDRITKLADDEMISVNTYNACCDIFNNNQEIPKLIQYIEDIDDCVYGNENGTLSIDMEISNCYVFLEIGKSTFGYFYEHSITGVLMGLKDKIKNEDFNKEINNMYELLK